MYQLEKRGAVIVTAVPVVVVSPLSNVEEYAPAVLADTIGTVTLSPTLTGVATVFSEKAFKGSNPNFNAGRTSSCNMLSVMVVFVLAMIILLGYGVDYSCSSSCLRICFLCSFQ